MLEIPMDQQFNWSLITPMASVLKFLRISTICVQVEDSYFTPNNGFQTWPHETINLQLLTGLRSLEKLVLDGIRLHEPQLRAIFTELPNLRDVELVSWTKMTEANNPNDVEDFHFQHVVNAAVAEEFRTRNQNLWDLLNASLALNRFVRIRLLDYSLLLCSPERRQRALKRPKNFIYTITWPQIKILKYREELWEYLKYPLLIKLK